MIEKSKSSFCKSVNNVGVLELLKGSSLKTIYHSLTSCDEPNH